MRLPLAAALIAAALLGSAVPAAHGAYRGKLEIRHSDDFRHDRTRTSYRLLRRGHRIPLMLARAPRTPSGSKVTVRGRRVGSRIRGRVRARGTVRAAQVDPGARKTAVILVKFAGNTTSWTPADIRERVFTDSDSVNAFYVDESYGEVSLTGRDDTDGDVYGWYTITGPTAGCPVDSWALKARHAAEDDGFDFDDYQHVIYMFPSQSSCFWAGLGELPGKQSWINGSFTTRVIAHELGHNMGLHHASSLSCSSGGQPVTYSSNCSADEYGDPFDVMGGQLRHNNGWHLSQIGFLPDDNVEVASASGTYTIDSALTQGASGQTQLLRVPRPGTSPQEYYDLDVRSSGGVFDNYFSTDPVVKGVAIRIDPDNSQLDQSMLLNANPESGFSNAPLAPGHSFSDGVVTISVQSVVNGTATVDVTAAPAPDTTAPSAPGPIDADAQQDRVTLGWPASTDDVGVAGYRVYRDLGLLATTTGTTFTDSNVQPGSSYSYRVTAFDAAGNSANSALKGVTVPGLSGPAADPAGPAVALGPPPDTTRPLVRLASPARHARLRRRRALVRARATDAVGVTRTEVWVDGVLRKAVDRARVRWRWPLRSAGRGRHLVLVRAYDAAGNHGVSGVRVRVARGPRT